MTLTNQKYLKKYYSVYPKKFEAETFKNDEYNLHFSWTDI